MWRRILKVARSLPVLVAAGLFGLYLLFGFFLVNPLAQRLLPWAGERLLASRLSAQRVEFNPLTLEVRVQGLTLAEPSGALLAGFDRLDVNLEVTGLARWAWRIRSIELERPRANIEVRPGGALNWGGLIARLQEGEKPSSPSDSIPRVLFDHIRVVGGELRYADADRPGEPFKAVLTPLGGELDGLSTLPEDRGDYLIAAKLPEQGGTLRWKGDIALNPIASQGELALEGARIEKLARVVESPLAAESSGTLAAALRYRFAMLRAASGADVPSLEVSGGNVTLQGLALAPRGGGEPLFQLAEARVTDVAFDLVRREIAVGAVRLERGRLAATRDAHGVIDWQAMLAPPAGTPAASRAAAPEPGPGAPWKIAVRDIRLAGWTARWTDQGYARPLSASAEGFELTAALAAQLDGAATRVDLGPVNAAVGPVQILSGTEPVAQLQRAAVTNAQLKLPDNRIRVEAVTLSGARTAVMLDKKQQLNWTEILRKAQGAPEAKGAEPAAKGAAPPDLRVARLGVEGINLRFTDASPAKPVNLEIAQGAIALQDVGLDLDRAIPVEAGLSVKQGGRLEARGTLVPGKPSGRLDLKLAGLSLQPFAPYVNQFARLQLHSGTAGTRGKLAFAPAKSGMALTFTGGLAVNDLAITEEDTGEAFLGWKKLSSDTVSLALAPDRLHIGELVALNPFGKVIIFEDQTVNLQRIRRNGAAPAPVAAPPAAAASAAAASAAPAFPVAVERLRIVGANAEFADLSLRPQFGTRMHDLSGVVTGLSTDPATTAQVELDGKVDDYGSARVRGSIQPFRATEFTDLTLAFRNIEMTRLTPYSGKFAGRRIESGRLSVDLEYKIKQRQLAGTNKFVVNKLKLGEQVDSPNAVKLPLDLAIALLEDSNGVIDLDLPVAGSLDDPQFSYGAIVWKAIVNVLTKLVTAPFRALGALLGVNSEKLEAIGFDPGSSVLLPPEQEKLKVLADALAKRPALTVTIEPRYDPEADRRALQDAAMRREAAAVAGARLAPGEVPGPVDVNHYKVQTWLEDRYAQQAGKDDYQKLRASFKDKDAGAAQRVMDSEFVERLGRSFKTRDTGPASAFHAELLERLARRMPVADAALVELAQARGRAMREAVVKLGLEEGRVAVAAPGQQAAKDKLVGSGLSLGAGKQAAGGPAPAQPAPAKS